MRRYLSIGISSRVTLARSIGRRASIQLQKFFMDATEEEESKDKTIWDAVVSLTVVDNKSSGASPGHNKAHRIESVGYALLYFGQLFELASILFVVGSAFRCFISHPFIP